MMNYMMIPIEVSARHVHLSKKVADVLFGKDYKFNIRKELSQPAQYAYEERVDIVGPKNILKSVAVLGPLRNKTQVEISMTDSFKIGVKSLIRESGDLDGTPGCTLKGPCGEYNLKSGLIVAKRHIHMHVSDAQKLGIKNGSIGSVKIKSLERSLVYNDVVIRVSNNFSLSMHIDTDEANAVNYKQGLTGELIL